jgi:hypothetical protein
MGDGAGIVSRYEAQVAIAPTIRDVPDVKRPETEAWLKVG